MSCHSSTVVKETYLFSVLINFVFFLSLSTGLKTSTPKSSVRPGVKNQATEDNGLPKPVDARILTDSV